MSLESQPGSEKLNRRKSSIGQLISTLVFLVMSIWLATASLEFYSQGQILRAFLVGTGGVLAFLATFRFQIQRFVNNQKKNK
jgi:ABC-type transport system involved in cytochrome c biogenesis permease subunit